MLPRTRLEFASKSIQAQNETAPSESTWALTSGIAHCRLFSRTDIHSAPNGNGFEVSKIDQLA